ncbi:alpha/beta hydrolase [Gordonia caeni]|uniref:alpha/beta fold hydrolase n=1 Tax=Gordonia caeni TaxID=1007097 RepID=UPI0031D2F0DA
MKVIRRGREHPDLAVTAVNIVRTSDVPPVLLVHGMGGDHTSWKRVIRTLGGAGRSVIAVDLRGHGRSQHAERYALDDFAGDLSAVLDELAVPRVDVVAHSLGAHSALRMAMAQPERVRRMVLEEPPPMPENDDDLAERIVPAFTGLGDRFRGIRALVTNPLPYVRYDRALPDEVAGQFDRTECEWWTRLSGLTAPAVVVSGGDRSFLPPRHLRRVAQALPNGEFVTIDSSHSVHRDRPTEFDQVLHRHLNS